MENDDKRIFAEALIGMAEVYDRKLSPAAAMIYFDDLKEFPLQSVLQAFTAHRKDPDRGRFFPKVADLIDKLDVKHEEVALVEWAKVLTLLPDSRRAKSDNPIVERVVQDLGGWWTLGHTNTDKLVWVAKEFVERYALYAAHGVDLPERLEQRKGLQRIGRAV